MPAERIFVDTNILVYAHDADGGEKHRQARDLIASLWHADEPPWLSVQVLQELFVNLVRKGMPAPQARDTVLDYLHWNLVENTGALLMAAMDIQQENQISLWDAMVVAAALQCGATRLFSEDLNPGQSFHGVIVHNPLV